ncbi:hypothetical protein [Cryptosporangium sp. NPDC048952]|uniref:hypothetical protein n=1 Tax=Cryptosporangium sp. NPDC048952 TaxID=3363961 RepID=UPI003711230B
MPGVVEPVVVVVEGGVDETAKGFWCGVTTFVLGDEEVDEPVEAELFTVRIAGLGRPSV